MAKEARSGSAAAQSTAATPAVTLSDTPLV